MGSHGSKGTAVPKAKKNSNWEQRTNTAKPTNGASKRSAGKARTRRGRN